MPKSRRRKGAVLIVVLAVLAVLSLLGTTFAIMNQIERTVSKNHLDEIRAKIVAKSGVAYGVSALQVDPLSPTLRYWGNDLNRNGLKDPNETLDGAAGVHEVALDWARYPSLAIMSDGNPLDTNNDVKMVTVRAPDGSIKPVGYSGAHEGTTYAGGLDMYQLKVSDLSGRIYLNDGSAMYQGNQSSVSQNLRRILNVLGKMKKIGIPQLGDKVLQNRPTRGYNTIEDLGRFLTPAEIRRVEPFVTCHAWVDKNVANPVPLSIDVVSEYPVKYYRGDQNVYRRGRGKNNSGSQVRGNLRWFTEGNTDKNHNAVYAMDELNPSYIEIVHRAPVNVNAASKEVLIALIADVQGFFISERRSFAPYNPSPASVPQGPVTIPQKYYSWWTVKQTYDENGEDCDQLGFLYKTLPLKAPESGSDEMGTQASGQGASAATVAEHILACRDRRDFGGVGYSQAWFAGTFKTWPQFNAFVDSLVENNVLVDTREVFMDYVPGSDWSKLNAVPSKAARKFAAYAIGDALKANFNPNLHLNELNPDHNLHLRVDKTDLVVNSTEFTFQPTGVFQVESIGRVLRPEQRTGSGDGSAMAIVAEKKIVAEVKVFDVYRETSQRHFYAGTMKQKDSILPTNSGYALETGPEVENFIGVDKDNFGGYFATVTTEVDGYRGYKPNSGPVATGWGYEYEGYIGLSTIGGDGQVRLKNKRAHTVPGVITWPDVDQYSKDRETLQVPFQHDFDARYSNVGDYKELAAIDGPDSERIMNYPDQDGDGYGPYGPATGAELKNRLSRSFRLPLNTAALAPGQTTAAAPQLPALPKYAPSDLRPDGFYSERNTGAAYRLRQTEGTTENPDQNTGNFAIHGGVVAMWIKPNFYPEHTGKMRGLVSMSRWHDKGYYRNPAPFNLTFVPGHATAAYVDNNVDELAQWQGTNGGGQPQVGGQPNIGGPIARKCEYLDPFGNMYDGNLTDGSFTKHTEVRQGAIGLSQLRPASLMGFRAATPQDAGSTSNNGYSSDNIDIENYGCTSTLNHNLSSFGLDSGSTPNKNANPAQLRPNYLEAHRWTHVMMSWQMIPPW